MLEQFKRPISSKLLDSNRRLARVVERHLSLVYPHLDINYDPALDLLEGQFREEMEEFIDLIIQTQRHEQQHR